MAIKPEKLKKNYLLQTGVYKMSKQDETKKSEDNAQDVQGDNGQEESPQYETSWDNATGTKAKTGLVLETAVNLLVELGHLSDSVGEMKKSTEAEIAKQAAAMSKVDMLKDFASAQAIMAGITELQANLANAHAAVVKSDLLQRAKIDVSTSGSGDNTPRATWSTTYKTGLVKAQIEAFRKAKNLSSAYSPALAHNSALPLDVWSVLKGKYPQLGNYSENNAVIEFAYDGENFMPISNLGAFTSPSKAMKVFHETYGGKPGANNGVHTTSWATTENDWGDLTPKLKAWADKEVAKIEKALANAK